MTAMYQNLIQDEVKRRINSGNFCYHSVQNILYSRLLSKNVKNYNMQEYNIMGAKLDV
jgi:hypothetical protein